MKHIEKMLDRMPNSRRAVYVAVAIGLAALIGVIVWLIVAVQQNSDALAHSAAVGRSRGQALGTANAKLTQNGIAPVTPKPEAATPGNTDLGPTTPSSTPNAAPGLQGETGASGKAGPGPSATQVAQAVTSYCDAHGDCSTKPTQAQVAAAVLTYCTSKDDCTGATGASGEPGDDATGKPGASGSPGAPGPAPTADQISAAVAAYCSDGACKGSKGDPGDSITGPAGPKGDTGSAGRDGSDGKNGTDAPHFTKIECSADNSWLFTLSDGSTLTAAGPCRASETTVTVTAPPTSPGPTSTAP